jgi:hypothetical protein
MRNHVVLACGLFLLAPATPAAEKETDRWEDLKWAKQVAADFLDSLYGAEGNKIAMGLLSPEMAKTFQDPDQLWRAYGGYSAWIILDQDLAPNGSEAMFLGNLKGWDCQGVFVVRVAKEPSGRWSIRYLRIHEIAVK